MKHFAGMSGGVHEIAHLSGLGESDAVLVQSYFAVRYDGCMLRSLLTGDLSAAFNGNAWFAGLILQSAVVNYYDGKRDDARKDLSDALRVMRTLDVYDAVETMPARSEEDRSREQDRPLIHEGWMEVRTELETAHRLLENGDAADEARVREILERHPRDFVMAARRYAWILFGPASIRNGSDRSLGADLTSLPTEAIPTDDLARRWYGVGPLDVFSFRRALPYGDFFCEQRDRGPEIAADAFY